MLTSFDETQKKQNARKKKFEVWKKKKNIVEENEKRNQKTIWVKNTICRVKNDDLFRINKWKWSNNSIKILRRTCMLFFWN